MHRYTSDGNLTLKQTPIPSKKENRKSAFFRIYFIRIDIFQEFLLPDATCIELFARNLLPNGTSWGNEVNGQLTHYNNYIIDLNNNGSCIQIRSLFTQNS